jgi:hypothetical protein
VVEVPHPQSPSIDDTRLCSECLDSNLLRQQSRKPLIGKRHVTGCKNSERCRVESSMTDFERRSLFGPLEQIDDVGLVKIE